MNIFDSEPCDDNLQKFRITCGEVYILTNIIELSKKIHSLDLIDSGKLDLNKLNMIIPKLMILTKPLINNENVADTFYFYLSSLKEKIEKFITQNNKENIILDDFCVISRKKCDDDLYSTSRQYKVYIYVKKRLDNY
jgi:hypothetical protein